MPQINLLPWREELRSRRQKEFGVMAVIAVLLMVGVIAGVHFHYQGQIDFQKRRNQFLEDEIAKLDKKIQEIEDLDNEKQRLLARMEIIQQLQSSRPEIVHLVDEIVKTLPEGVYYTKIQQKGKNINMQGIAQSNARVSSLMRQLDGSEWLQDPRLIEIKALGKGAEGELFRLSSFNLNIEQTVQKKESDALKKDASEDDDGKKKKKKKKKKRKKG